MRYISLLFAMALLTGCFDGITADYGTGVDGDYEFNTRLLSVDEDAVDQHVETVVHSGSALERTLSEGDGSIVLRNADNLGMTVPLPASGEIELLLIDQNPDSPDVGKHAYVSGTLRGNEVMLPKPWDGETFIETNTQAVRVFNFNNLIISAQSRIVPEPWNKDTLIGGVLAVRVRTNLRMEPGAMIDANGRGYAGGRRGTPDAANLINGGTGEGPGGSAGGGAYVFKVESTGQVRDGGLGGAGGSFRTKGGNPAGSPTSNLDPPSPSETYGSDLPTEGLLMGSGGGGGAADPKRDNVPAGDDRRNGGRGGSGGGIVVISARRVTAQQAVVRANGGDGNSQSEGGGSGTAGGGGGGSGGTVVVFYQNGTIPTLEAKGGEQGTEGHAGGVGGDGLVWTNKD